MNLIMPSLDNTLGNFKKKLKMKLKRYLNNIVKRV